MTLLTMLDKLAQYQTPFVATVAKLRSHTNLELGREFINRPRKALMAAISASGRGAAIREWTMLLSAVLNELQ